MDPTVLPPSSGIYAIVNRVTGDRYVGQAKDIRRRVMSHLRDLRAGTHKTNAARVLQLAWHEYGEANFDAVVLELIQDDRSVPYRERPDPLSLAEHYYIAEKSEYNPDKRIVKGFEHLIEAKAWRRLGESQTQALVEENDAVGLSRDHAHSLLVQGFHLGGRHGTDRANLHER